MAKISKIVIHCSDTPDERDIGVDVIRRYHMAKPPVGRGWKDVGYHYIVRRNGVIEVGRPEDGDNQLSAGEVGAHALGHNSESLGVCWIGRTSTTRKQLVSTVEFTARLCKRLGLAAADVYGHGELDTHGKTCPNLDMRTFRTMVAAELARAA